MSWYLKKRVDAIEYFISNSSSVQEETFVRLLSQLKKTKFATDNDLEKVTDYKQFKQKVPIHSYDDIKPYIERVMKGEQNVLWPGEITWFAKSSGTTSDKSKFIPVSQDTLNDCQFRGSRDVLALYYNEFPDAKIFQGKGLIIGGSHKVNELAPNTYYGDLSAVMMNNLPFLANYLATPSMDIALMDNWEEKLEKMVAHTMDEDVTNISGVPTWTLILIKRLLESSGKSILKEVWPNLELYVHGGINFDPYKAQFQELIGPGVRFRETYNASEGFFGVQDSADKDMLLMMDYGIFYEFIPIEDLAKEDPRVFWIDDVELEINYALVISTSSGLWRYLVGDTIKFTSKAPYRIKITGRTKLFINAFGEELMIDNTDKAIEETQKICRCMVKEYTAAPIYLEGNNRGGHQWLIEFEKEPENLDHFISTLDNELKKVNSDYEAKRQADIALVKPKVNVLKEGTFYQWMRSKNKIGGQHKVPRLSNDRKIVEDILTFEA